MCVGFVLLVLFTAGIASAQELKALPAPHLEPEEADVQGQLESARSRLDQELAALESLGGVDRLSAQQKIDLANRYAELGRLYYLYDLLPLAEIAWDNALLITPGAVDWRYLRAVTRGVAGKYEKALEDYNAVVDARPNDIPALLRRGELLYDMARYSEAERDYQRVQELRPQSAAALAGLGQLAHRNGDHQRAVSQLREALRLQPEADALNYSLALSLRAIGENDAARQAMRLNKEGRVAFPDPLVDRLSSDNRSASALLHSGNDAMRRGDMAEAESLFRRFLLRRPEDAVATHNLGLVLLAQQKREGGLAALRRAVELDPEFRGGHYYLGSVLAEDGLFEQALVHYQKAHELDPQEQSIHADYATLLARLGRVDEALDELEPVVTRDPDAHYIRLKYATILSVAGQRVRAEPLLIALTDEKMDAPVRAEALYHLAMLRLDANQLPAAKRYLERSLELGPASGPTNKAMAQLLARAGDVERAVVHYERAVLAEPMDDRTQFGYAMGLLLLDRDAEARTALESALQLMPSHQGLQHILARVLASSSEQEVRDGEQAHRLARALLERSRTPEHVETLAMALAELGRFDEALEWQRRVLSQAGTSGTANPAMTARAEAYRSGEAVRDPWEVQ